MRKNIRAVALYLDVSMHKNHAGLSELSADLESNDLILYVNKSKTAYKAVIAPHCLVYFRAPSGRLTLNDFKDMPLLFGAEKLRIDKTVMDELLKILNIKLKAIG